MLKITHFQAEFDKLLLDERGVYCRRRWKKPECQFFRTKLTQANIVGFSALADKIIALRFRISTRPLCICCGNPVKSDSYSPTGFRETCSVKCAANNPNTKAKTKNTLSERYGGHHMRNPKFIGQFVDALHAADAYTRGQKTFAKRYGVENRFQLKTVKAKIKNTNLVRYGVENPQQLAEIRKKTENTNLVRYGTTHTMPKLYGDLNPMRDEKNKFAGKITRHRNMYLERNDITYYSFGGHNHFTCGLCRNEFRSRRNDAQCPACYGPAKHKLQNEIYAFVRQLCLDAERDVRKPLGGLELDIYVPSHNLGIEFNGLYWHGERQGIDNGYHLQKTLLGAERNIKIIHIFEHEWVLKTELVKSMISAQLKKSQIQVMAERCEARELSSIDAKNFFAENYIHEFVPGVYSIGLFYMDECVMAMHVGDSLSGEGVVELLHIAAKQNVDVVGGAGKILKGLALKYSQIISYCDRRWSAGEIYEQLGFVEVSTIPPNYWYIDKAKKYSVYSRSNFEKHQLGKMLLNFDPMLDEWQNMQANGYDRIWDCGAIKYEYYAT